MANARKSNTWSYSAGERGRNRARVYEERRTGTLMLEWYEPGPDGRKRRRKSLKHRDQEKAKRQADQFAAEWGQAKPQAESQPQETADVSLQSLFDRYKQEKTPTKGESQQGQDKRAFRCFKAFFNAQPDKNRRMDRHPETLDRTDYEKFIEWRRAGKIPGWERKVGDKQIRNDLSVVIAVLNWAIGQKRDRETILKQNPWSGRIRRRQNWPKPKEKNPRRPSMTDAIRDKLIEHSPKWQFGAALRLGRFTGRRNNSIRQLRWSDVDLTAGAESVLWRGELDKSGGENRTPLLPEAVEILKGLPSRGIGDAPVFPSGSDPTQPTPSTTFQTWLRRAKTRWLETIEDGAERRRLEDRLDRLGFHGEKRAAVRDKSFRDLPPKIQEALTGTNYETLRRIYDEVPVEDQRAALEEVRNA